MAIKAIFPTGVDSITLSKGLYQWDYGQQLEIEAVDLSPIVEVHFSCQGMKEAEVRPCNTVNGTAIVAIPDICLEQSSKITAWVFEIDGEQGHTTKTINIPIIARTRPAKSSAIPQGFVDCYTELISAVNAAVKVLTDGDVTAKYAISAGNASSANTAGHANTADNATNVSGKMGEVSQYTHVWFSDPDTETKRAFSERLTYNPRDNTLKVGHLDGKASSAVRADIAENATKLSMSGITPDSEPTNPGTEVEHYSTSISIEKTGLYVIDVGFNGCGEMEGREIHGRASIVMMISDFTQFTSVTDNGIRLIPNGANAGAFDVDVECRFNPSLQKLTVTTSNNTVTPIIAKIYRIGGLEG